MVGARASINHWCTADVDVQNTSTNNPVHLGIGIIREGISAISAEAGDDLSDVCGVYARIPGAVLSAMLPWAATANGAVFYFQETGYRRSVDI